MELLSVRYNIADDDNEVIESGKEAFEKYMKRSAPATLSASAAAELQAPVGTKPTFQVYVPESHDDEEIELAKRLSRECLNERRADCYKTWMEVGWCLSNIENSEEMFEVWVDFSKKSTKSDGTDWGRHKRDWMKGFSRNTPGSKLTLKSLHYWAREDNPEKYKELVEEDHIRYVQQKVDETHYHIAKLLKRMYKGTYCASVEIRRIEWYYYDASINSWRHTNQGMELREKLSTEVVDLIVAARMRLKKKGYDEYCEQNAIAVGQGREMDEDWFKQWGATFDGGRFETLHKIEKKLYQTDFKNCVMKEAAELFCEEDFLNQLNMNTQLFACRNGVLDLRMQVQNTSTGELEEKVVFRPGKPDDSISFLAGRNYPDTEPLDYVEYDAEDPQQHDLMEFLKKIFPNHELLRYYLRLMASCLEGANREQCYYTFIGVGGNGKSKVVDLMRYTFGDYCCSLQATALTRKRPESGAANPDIISIKNKRFIYLQEPDDKEPLNTSRMKQFSGEDVVEARALYEDQQRFRITGKLFMMCNRLPPITSMDRGTWRRIRVIPFGSKFVDPSDPELKTKKANVFLRDNKLDEKLRMWREAWLGLLVHIFETEYLVNGLEPIPQAVLEESSKYRDNFDQYGKFKAERMIDFRDPRLGLEEYGDEKVSLKELQNAYNTWTKQNEGTLTGKRLSKQELQTRLEEDFGALEAGCFKRLQVFFDDDLKTEFETERRIPEA